MRFLKISVINSPRLKTFYRSISGLIPRCINYIFKVIKRIEQKGKDRFEINFSMLEIYQEKVNFLHLISSFIGLVLYCIFVVL